eukprot:m.295130 g.295130  ORF g.295130 m.295130 type:complete len:345 (+) comp40757_c0_seq35:1342-2376(+)
MTTPSTITTVSPTSNKSRPTRVTTTPSSPPTSTAGVSSQTTAVTSSVVSAISTSSAGYLTTMTTMIPSTPTRLTTTPSPSSSAPTSTSAGNSSQTTAVTSFVPSASSTASVVHVTTTILFSGSFTPTPTEISTDKPEGRNGKSLLYIAAGAGGGALVFIMAVVIIAIVVWKRRTQKFNHNLPGDSSHAIINPTYVLSDSVYQQPNGVEGISLNETNGNEYEEPVENKYPQTSHAPLKKVESIYYSTLEESLYWQPATTVTELYAQIEGKKLPKIQRETVVIEKELGSGEFGKVAKGIWSPVTVRRKRASLRPLQCSFLFSTNTKRLTSLSRLSILRLTKIMSSF